MVVTTARSVPSAKLNSVPTVNDNVRQQVATTSSSSLQNVEVSIWMSRGNQNELTCERCRHRALRLAAMSGEPRNALSMALCCPPPRRS